MRRFDLDFSFETTVSIFDPGFLDPKKQTKKKIWPEKKIFGQKKNFWPEKKFLATKLGFKS